MVIYICHSYNDGIMTQDHGSRPLHIDVIEWKTRLRSRRHVSIGISFSISPRSTNSTVIGWMVVFSEKALNYYFFDVNVSQAKWRWWRNWWGAASLQSSSLRKMSDFRPLMATSGQNNNNMAAVSGHSFISLPNHKIVFKQLSELFSPQFTTPELHKTWRNLATIVGVERKRKERCKEK